MKKFLTLAFVAIMAFSSCSGSGTKDVGSLVVVENDEGYSPDMKVTQPTVIDFNATWCGPCKMFAPVFHEAAEKYSDVKFVSIDVDKNPSLAMAFQIQAIPTVVILTPEGKQKRYVGTEDLIPAEKFDVIVKDLLK